MASYLGSEGNGSDQPLPKPNVVVAMSGTPPEQLLPEALSKSWMS